MKKIIIALAAAALLAGCGAPAGAHNDADVTFVQDMIPHHEQAVEMAGLAAGRSENAAVVDLAGRIGTAQTAEIETMNGWLQEWGVEAPAGDDMAGMEMGGMLTPEQLGRLDDASGAAFDRQFLGDMTGHHVGAIEDARTELAQGADPDALTLARSIVDTQQAELDEMAELLAQL